MACDWCGFGFRASGGLYVCSCRTPCGARDCSAPKEETMPSEPEAQSADPMVAALLRERAGLVQRGLDDRVAQVDEQLRLRGYHQPGKKAEQPAGAPVERSTPPRGRRGR